MRPLPAIYGLMITTQAIDHWRRLSGAAERANAGEAIPQLWWCWLARFCEELGLRDALIQDRESATPEDRAELDQLIADCDRSIADQQQELLAFLKVQDVAPSPAGTQ